MEASICRRTETSHPCTAYRWFLRHDSHFTCSPALAMLCLTHQRPGGMGFRSEGRLSQRYLTWFARSSCCVYSSAVGLAPQAPACLSPGVGRTTCAMAFVLCKKRCAHMQLVCPCCGGFAPRLSWPQHQRSAMRDVPAHIVMVCPMQFGQWSKWGAHWHR